MRYSNEIARLTASPNPSFKAGEKLILECVSLKFQACRENKGASYTNRVLQLTKNKKYGIDLYPIPYDFRRGNEYFLYQDRGQHLRTPVRL